MFGFIDVGLINDATTKAVQALQAWVIAGWLTQGARLGRDPWAGLLQPFGLPSLDI